MSEPTAPSRLSALAGIASEADSGSSLGQRVSVSAREITRLNLLVLRGDQKDPAFLTHTSQALGTPLPLLPSTFTETAKGKILWISPDQWWVLCSDQHKDALLQSLHRHSNAIAMQALDNSGSLAALELFGANHLTVLRHLTPFDVESMETGACISTAVPQATLTILRPDPARVIILFRRSFAGWIWQLVRRSARPYGLRVTVGADPT